MGNLCDWRLMGFGLVLLAASAALYHFACASSGSGSSRSGSSFDHWIAAEASQWLAESIHSLPNPDSARHHLATALVKDDINAAKAWAESISGELQRKLTTSYVAREWSRYESWAAKAWATETLGWTEEECVERLH